MVQVFVMKCAQSAIDFLFSIKVTKSITLQLQTLTINISHVIKNI